MLPLSDEIHLISRSDIAVVTMIQDTEETDAMIGITKKSEAEVQIISRSTKMNGTKSGRKIELHLVLEVQRHQTEETDLLINEDVHLKTTRPN